jgi:hypothetical protein
VSTLTTILQSPFLKSVVIPILLAFLAALLQCMTLLIRGRSKGQYKFRLWVKQGRGKSTTLMPVPHQRIQDIRNHKQAVDIERMPSLDWGDFTSVGIDLILGAFAVDIVSLTGGQKNSILTPYLLFIHLLMLVGVLLFLMLGQVAPPEDRQRKTTTVMATVLGTVAMMLSFFSL